MKCFTASVLDCLDEIKKIKQPVIFVATGDEETRLKCIENVIDKLKELNIKPKFTILGEPTTMKINAEANGCYEFEIKVYGKSCHSSIPKNGINSINILAKLISFLENEQEKYPNTTSNAGIIKGGDIVNRVPDFASLTFDVRSTIPRQVYQLLKNLKVRVDQLKKEYGTKITIKKLLEIPPLENRQTTLVSEISNKLNLSIEKFNGGCEAGYYQSYSGDSIIFGVGDLNLAHKPNENMVIADYFRYNQILIEMLQYLDEKYS